MAKVLLLAQEKKPVAVFSQLKKMYCAIEQLEGKQPDNSEVSHLFLPFKEPKTLTYPRLSKIMADNGRTAIFTETDKENPKYTIFLFQMNELGVLSGSDESESE